LTAPASYVYQFRWQEDGTAIVKARVAAHDGTGKSTGIPGEGYFLKQADLSTITCLVYDVTGAANVATPSVTISSAISDTPITTQALWRKGNPGYNFSHTLAASNFPTGGSTYRVEYKFTTTGSTVFWLKIEGVADAAYTS
jgi:hypothetical protein